MDIFLVKFLRFLHLGIIQWWSKCLVESDLVPTWRWKLHRACAARNNSSVPCFHMLVLVPSLLLLRLQSMALWLVKQVDVEKTFITESEFAAVIDTRHIADKIGIMKSQGQKLCFEIKCTVHIMIGCGHLQWPLSDHPSYFTCCRANLRAWTLLTEVPLPSVLFVLKLENVPSVVLQSSSWLSRLNWNKFLRRICKNWDLYPTEAK